MSEDTRPVTVSILDKDYNVACSEGERASLLEAVDFLDSRMRELRDGGRLLGAERVAVMTALNIVHEFLELQRNAERSRSHEANILQRVDAKLAALLEQVRAPGNATSH
jgi:cell division protein ZapA